MKPPSQILGQPTAGACGHRVVHWVAGERPRVSLPTLCARIGSLHPDSTPP